MTKCNVGSCNASWNLKKTRKVIKYEQNLLFRQLGYSMLISQFLIYLFWLYQLFPLRKQVLSICSFFACVCCGKKQFTQAIRVCIGLLGLHNKVCTTDCRPSGFNRGDLLSYRAGDVRSHSEALVVRTPAVFWGVYTFSL